jgi:hypothetical protein
MVSVLASSVVDRRFEPRPDQTKDYKIGICCSSAKHAEWRRKNKDCLAWNQDTVSEWVTGLESRYCVRVGDRLGIKIMCQSGWQAGNQDTVSEWVTGLESKYCVRVGDRLGIKILCQSVWQAWNQDTVSEWMICLPADCCCSELALWKSN